MATLTKKSSYTQAGGNGGTATLTTASDTSHNGAKGKTAKSARRSGPSHDEIAARAYELYVQRGCTEGHAEEDWVRAETELRGDS